MSCKRNTNGASINDEIVSLGKHQVGFFNRIKFNESHSPGYISGFIPEKSTAFNWRISLEYVYQLVAATILEKISERKKHWKEKGKEGQRTRREGKLRENRIKREVVERRNTG